MHPGCCTNLFVVVHAKMLIENDCIRSREKKNCCVSRVQLHWSVHRWSAALRVGLLQAVQQGVHQAVQARGEVQLEGHEEFAEQLQHLGPHLQGGACRQPTTQMHTLRPRTPTYRTCEFGAGHRSWGITMSGMQDATNVCARVVEEKMQKDEKVKIN